jgi:hypothetical protein
VLGCAATAQARVLFSSTKGLMAGPARAADGRLVVAERIPGGVFDGRTLYAIRSDCDADRLLAIDVDAPGPALSRSGLEPLSCP